MRSVSFPTALLNGRHGCLQRAYGLCTRERVRAEFNKAMVCDKRQRVRLCVCAAGAPVRAQVARAQN